MNILMALSQLEVTGAEVYAVNLASELIKRGNNVYIVSDTLTKKTEAEYFKIEFNKRKLLERIGHIKELLRIIKEKDIHVVHAHSRASSWSSGIACKIAGIPLITTTHGKQPVHMSRKIIKGFGDYSLAVCENVYEQMAEELHFKREKIEVLRNPVNCEEYAFSERKKADEKIVVSIIGRLSGPKGDVTFELLKELTKKENYAVQVIGGKDIPERFEQFKNRVNFMGYINNVSEEISKSHVVIGAGRVAVEGILSGVPVIAVGEAEYIGAVSEKNIDEALKSNFGDIGNVGSDDIVNVSSVNEDIENSLLKGKEELLKLRNIVEENFSFKKIVDRIEKIYSKQYVLKKKYEMPVIMYHRVVEDKEENKGVHGTYITVEKFEEHMKYLKDKGFKTVTFEDLKNGNYRHRFDRGNKWIVLTFDDGYKDNYTHAFPILKKYGFKSVIYLLGTLKYNKWDVDNPENPEKRFPLMDDNEILEMQEYGIEFGGHSMTHSKMSKLDKNTAREEIIESKAILEKKLGRKLNCFAYPYGDRDEGVKKFAEEEGYEFAVATDSGDISFQEDLYNIRRIGIFPTNGLRSFKRKTSGKYNFIKLKREHRASGGK